MVQPNKQLAVLLTGPDVMRFQKVYSYYMGMDKGDTLGLLTRSGLLRVLILNEYENLLKNGSISPIQSER